MSEKLKDYQVLDVLCGGTFYKVKHKVTNNIFAWKAYNCSAYSDELIQNVVNEVKTISKVTSGNLLRYYDTILHGPSKTLYFVLEYSCWQSVQELIGACDATDKYFTESFIWHLLLELARACKIVEDFTLVAVQKCISVASIFVGENGDVRINCFDLLPAATQATDLVRQVGRVASSICYRSGAHSEKFNEFYYSDDLRDVVSFLTDDRNVNLRPDVILFHPTVLANADSQARPKHFSEIIVRAEYSHSNSEVNKCDSEKVGELCKTIEPLPRTRLDLADSPIYCNVTPKAKFSMNEEPTYSRGSLSPTLAALALELPGYVPRSRKPYAGALETYNGPQKVSEETFSQQWMSRLIALRQREECLNKRERDIIAKEIVNSPSTKMITDSQSSYECNGITLPAVMTQGRGTGEERSQWVSRRRQRKAGSVRARGRRKSYAYEDLDSSLSADAGDGSIIVTATRFTKENMPRRNIFSDLSSKKVHFTSNNPFVESDESVTLTFYDLENVDNGHKQQEVAKSLKDITKFKYLDVENVTTEKREADQWRHSPSKQAKIVGQIFADITNHGGLLRKTPSKSSITSRCSTTSKCSGLSSRSEWGVNSSNSKTSEDSVSDRSRASFRQSVAPTPAPPELKKTKSRRSLLPFKTPFKLRSASTKV